MDQSAFRDLLASAPPKAPTTGRAAGVLGGQTLKRGYGGGAGRLKDFAPKEKTDKGEASKPEFAPRKVKKDSKYKDRAEMRRLGVEDEFKPIERMLDDFEQRAKAEGEDEDSIAAKRAYLGGDADHSALFKGLDYSLLEVRKAELAAQEGTKYDEELDKVLENALPPDEVMSAEAGPGPSTTGQKRSREDIMSALQESRKRLIGGDVLEGEKKKKRSKVEAPSEAPTAGLGSRFKKIAAIATETDGKKKKKKKIVKAVPAPSEAQRPVPPQPGLTIISAKADIPESPAVILEREKRLEAERLRRRSPSPPPARPAWAEETTEEPAVAEQEASPPPLSAASAPADLPEPIQSQAPAALDSDEEDIFGGVSDYEMDLGSDSESDAEKTKPLKPANEARAQPILPPKKGKGWFGDEDEEQEEAKPSDSMLPNILRTTKPADESAQRLPSRSPSPEDGTLRPLQPLSSSKLPSAKELLAMDKAAEADEKRREKKAKWRAKQGLAAQDGVGGDDDGDTRGDRGKTDKEKEIEEKRKLHVETQRLEAYMTKKKQG